MKKWSLTFVIFAALFLAACGGGESKGSDGSSKTETSSAKVLDAEDFDSMYSNPKDYKGYEVIFVDSSNTTSLKFIIEGYSDDNWDIEFKPFVFNVE